MKAKVRKISKHKKNVEKKVTKKAEVTVDVKAVDLIVKIRSLTLIVKATKVYDVIVYDNDFYDTLRLSENERKYCDSQIDEQVKKLTQSDAVIDLL